MPRATGCTGCAEIAARRFSTCGPQKSRGTSPHRAASRITPDAVSIRAARSAWKQLVIGPEAANEAGKGIRAETLVVLGLAVAAAMAVKIPALFGLPLSPDQELPPFYARNASLFAFPMLTIYFLWKRGAAVTSGLWLALRRDLSAVAAATTAQSLQGELEEFKRTCPPF